MTITAEKGAQRKDAVTKTTGKAVYAFDIALPGMLQAKVLRSPHAHARVVSIDVRRARDMPGVGAALSRDDLAGLQPYYGFVIKDQPIVAVDRVRYIGDVVAAVAADTEEHALAALEAIDVVYEPLAAVCDVDDALLAGAVELFEEQPFGVLPSYGLGVTARLWPKRNVAYEFHYETGDPQVWQECDHVFEDSFVFSRMNHFHLEPFVTVASWDDEQIELWTSTQNPFPLRKELARVFQYPENRIRVHVPFVGGSFGAKHNCKTEPIAILLAKLSGRPVRYCLTTEEAFLTLTQHPAKIRMKTGVMSDGRLVARETRILLESGAYTDGSPLVAEKAGYRTPGPYRWQRIDATCACVMTNTTPSGPFRGFGATQVTWASESQIDMIAHRLRLDPYEMRVQNFKRLHEPFVPGESGIDSDLRAGLDAVVTALGLRERTKQRGRGFGLAVGLKDGGGINKPAQARVKVSTTGSVYLHCGAVEAGQGVTTSLCEVVARTLAVPLERVSYAPINSDHTPFDQGTNASSSIVVMGQAVLKAAESVRRQVLDFASEQLGCSVVELELADWTIRRRDQEFPVAAMIAGEFGGTGFEFTGEGYTKARLTPSAPLEAQCVFWEIGWVGAEVEVDEDTGKVTVAQLVVVGDAGHVLNEQNCRGQDEGAAAMGLAQSLFEEMRYDGCTLLNGEALDYRVLLAEDLPRRFVSITQQQGHGPGPFGAKGMGEGGMLAVASAVANAVFDAVGARVTTLPISPERVLDALDSRYW